MKKYLIVLIAAMAIISCKKEGARDLSGDPGTTKVKLPTGDPILVNHAKDEQARLFRKGGNPNNPHTPNGGGNGGGGGGNPPPVVMHKACWLIDHNGYFVSNDDWGTVDCSGSDFDAAQIADVIARVKSYRDAAGLDIEVTTGEALYYTYPVNKRMRVVLTRTNFYGYVGGVAYLNSLLWTNEEKQCFVFVDLLSRSTKNTADATAHEMGHTAGDVHHVETVTDELGFCYISSPYLRGDHIMGNSYDFPDPRYKKGQSGCNEDTDDIAIFNNTINQ